MGAGLQTLDLYFHPDLPEVPMALVHDGRQKVALPTVAIVKPVALSG